MTGYLHINNLLKRLKMLNEFSRTELLIGKEALQKLAASRVAVFGIGGVGSYAVEGLVRSGVGKLVLIDDDCICLTNINRQLHATRKTVGKPKVEVCGIGFWKSTHGRKLKYISAFTCRSRQKN